METQDYKYFKREKETMHAFLENFKIFLIVACLKKSNCFSRRLIASFLKESTLVLSPAPPPNLFYRMLS